MQKGHLVTAFRTNLLSPPSEAVSNRQEYAALAHKSEDTLEIQECRNILRWLGVLMWKTTFYRKKVMELLQC